MRIDLDAYAARLGMALPRAVDVRSLDAVQRAHRLAIPFENIEPRLGRGVDLDPAAVFDKLVVRRRGGYCFEHNQLFGRVLEALGFAVRPLLGRVWRDMDDVPPRTHTCHLVTLDGQEWLADAGFGGGYAPVMPLVAGGVATGPDGVRHRLDRDADHGWMLWREGREGWQPQYSFTLDRVWPQDLEMANHWTATRPGSRFLTLVMVTRPTSSGFLSLTDRRLAGEGAARDITDAESWRRIVRDRFDLDLPLRDVAALGLF